MLESEPLTTMRVPTSLFQELDKRANYSRISRKERLRKEVMAAREMDQLQQQGSNQLQSDGTNKEIQRKEQTENRVC